jgi:hypothetical protein
VKIAIDNRNKLRFMPLRIDGKAEKSAEESHQEVVVQCLSLLLLVLQINLFERI